MRTKLEKISLVVIGAVLGVSLSLNYPAVAEKETKPQLPLDELRTFA
jgi:carboxyl-terminal processing protease